jgi:hypothetical protein
MTIRAEQTAENLHTARLRLPDRDFAGTYPAGAVQDRWRVILNTTPSGRI